LFAHSIVPEATEGARPVSTTTTTTGAPTGTWQLDPVHSTVAFEVGYMGGRFKGQFREVEATLDVADTATLAGTATVSSIDVKDETLAAHLQSPDFFDAERHPEIAFRADGIRFERERVLGAGELTIKGVTRPLAVDGDYAGPVPDAFGGERVRITLTATLDRTDFGVSWNTPLPSGDPALSNEVAVVGELIFKGV
jgi:polyisoprenoid-binding protein YceI